MGCGIYIIKNTVNGKVYIGSSIDIKTRLIRHKSMLRGGYHDNEYLQNSFNKYGESSFTFEVVDECSSDELHIKENKHIEEFKSNNLNYGYNLALVSEDRKNKFSDETKVKMSKVKLKNYTKFMLINIKTNIEYEFDNLVDAALYLKSGGFSNGKLPYIRQKLSSCLRGIKVNNGSNNKGSIRKTIYKHKYKIIN